MKKNLFQVTFKTFWKLVCLTGILQLFETALWQEKELSSFNNGMLLKY